MKITISEEEAANAKPHQPQPSYSPPPQQPSTPYPVAQAAKPFNPMWILAGGGGLIALIFLVGIMLVLSGSGLAKNQTKADYVSAFVADTQKLLNEPQNMFFKFVEEAHVSVTAKSATVKSCSADTIDGSDLAGQNDENISRVYLCVTVKWDGILHKDGYSDVSIVIDAQQDQIIEAAITDSNAAVNINDPEFWKGIGEMGAILLLL